MDLADLYALLPAAEEEDLLEQLAEERRSGEAPDAWPAGSERAGDVWSGAPADDEDVPEPERDEDDRPLPLPVLLGLLEHRLGATRLDRPTQA